MKSHQQKNTLLKYAQANAESNFFKTVFFSPSVYQKLCQFEVVGLKSTPIEKEGKPAFYFFKPLTSSQLPGLEGVDFDCQERRIYFLDQRVSGRSLVMLVENAS